MAETQTMANDLAADFKNSFKCLYSIVVAGFVRKPDVNGSYLNADFLRNQLHLRAENALLRCRSCLEIVGPSSPVT